MRAPRSCHRKDPKEMTRSELISAVKRMRKIIDERPIRILTAEAVVAVDRTGKNYTRNELLSVFERVYPENPRAICLMFPTMTIKAVHGRAERFGISGVRTNFLASEDAIIQKRFPEYKKASEELGRSVGAVKKRAAILGLQLDRAGPLWTPDEDSLLYQGRPVPGRNAKSMNRRRGRLKINGNYIRAVRSISPEELRRLIVTHVAKGYREQYRVDAIAEVQRMCMEGRCGIKPEELVAAGKKAVAAVYKLHPDRGAPISMDAKLFDDGEATVGDRISSDAFHF